MIELYLTKTGAMRGFVDRMSALEGQGGVLSVSLSHGFPWGDVADVGARVLVITDGDAGAAEELADRLAREFHDLRDEVTSDILTLDDALDRAAASPDAPVVIADMGDNSGGGAAGDSTFVLRALMERGLANVATGIYWDPAVVRMCEDAGEGATLHLRLGGKTGLLSGDPVDLEAEVVKIASGLGQHLGVGLEPLGTLVRLRMGDDVDILVNDLRVQVYHPEAFEQMGIVLADKALVTVKSMFHFYGPFAEISPLVLQAGTPGGTSPRFDQIAYTKRPLDYWPRVKRRD